jgi:hypothetical protein
MIDQPLGTWDIWSTSETVSKGTRSRWYGRVSLQIQPSPDDQILAWPSLHSASDLQCKVGRPGKLLDFEQKGDPSFAAMEALN